MHADGNHASARSDREHRLAVGRNVADGFTRDECGESLRATANRGRVEIPYETAIEHAPRLETGVTIDVAAATDERGAYPKLGPDGNLAGDLPQRTTGLDIEERD